MSTTTMKPLAEADLDGPNVVSGSTLENPGTGPAVTILEVPGHRFVSATFVNGDRRFTRPYLVQAVSDDDAYDKVSWWATLTVLGLERVDMVIADAIPLVPLDRMPHDFERMTFEQAYAQAYPGSPPPQPKSELVSHSANFAIEDPTT